MNNPEARLLVPIPETRRILGGLGLTTTYELFKRGDLVKVNIGRRSFVTKRSLDAYVDRLTEAATGSCPDAVRPGGRRRVTAGA